MTAGLPLSDIVNAQVTLDPQASATRNFGTLLIVGSESVLSDTEDLRSYSSLDSVGDDYAVTSPVYLAATLFYAQSPQPSTLYVGEQRTSETNLTTTVQRLAAASGDWYGLAFAMATMPTDTVIVQVAQQIEALTPVRTFWATTQDANAIVSSSTTDLAYLLCQANVSRTWCQYSTSNPYASISAFARIATVNYSGQNTTLTLKFKNEPDVTSETLTTTEYSALKAKYCNVFALLQNGESIIQEGYMADGTWADTRIGCDAFQNGLQVAGFNLLYSNLKIPQTDAGMVILKGTYDTVCQTYVTNGLFAPGVWTGPTIGALKNGDTLNDGYYIYCPSVASQSAADRSARKAVTMQIACKLAGAVHSSNVLVNVVQ
ncbi:MULTISPECIES: DUF3383 family protein [Acetobacter]|uniref:DUF3383 family protein n=1 Tax=Acetobacter TaxID=434 RepID=UPI000A3B7197|nr:MULTISPECIES: DUF3383 family protein [Acetobacter]MBS1003168.1 DUF3383 family protein [Acetobacter thailandicus]OUJ08381.1 hypothetical protein HK25_13225 [Acetobacter sp. DsW_059]